MQCGRHLQIYHLQKICSHFELIGVALRLAPQLVGFLLMFSIIDTASTLINYKAFKNNCYPFLTVVEFLAGSKTFPPVHPPDRLLYDDSHRSRSCCYVGPQQLAENVQ